MVMSKNDKKQIFFHFVHGYIFLLDYLNHLMHNLPLSLEEFTLGPT